MTLDTSWLEADARGQWPRHPRNLRSLSTLHINRETIKYRTDAPSLPAAMSQRNSGGRPRSNFLSNPARSRSLVDFSAASSRGFRQGRRPPFGVPPYIWVTAGGSAIVVSYGYFSYVEEVPLTRRRRWIATPPTMERQLGNQEYQNLLKQFRKDILPPSHRASMTVERVGSRIEAAAMEFCKEHDVRHMGSSPFTYTLVRSEMANAFVLPGNHVFVMTGLFRFVQNEDDLASVLSHEVAHNVARHAGEKISGSAVVNLIARLSLLFDPSGFTFSILLPATTLFRTLPHSRTQETEADEIGVHLAAKACFDPRASKRVFSAMMNGLDNGKNGTKRSPPEFLSTHPSHESRISNFDKWMPDAMSEFQSDNGERCRRVRRDMELARRYAAQQALIREYNQSASSSASSSANSPGERGSPL